MRLHDLVFDFEPAQAEERIAAWMAGAVDDPARGWTADELAEHVRIEYSTYSWLFEPMLERTGFEILERALRPWRLRRLHLPPQIAVGVCEASDASDGVAIDRVECGDQFGRRHSPVGVFTDRGHLGPVDVPVETYSQPASAADVRWAEEPLGLGVDEFGLDAGGGGTPQMGEIVVVVAARPQHHELLLHLERGAP